MAGNACQGGGCICRVEVNSPLVQPAADPEEFLANIGMLQTGECFKAPIQAGTAAFGQPADFFQGSEFG